MNFMILTSGLCGENLARLGHARENVVKCQNSNLFSNYSKTGHRIVLIFCMMMEANELYDLAQAV